MIELADLLSVRAICDAGSFRRAASALGITQPTLSARIARIEAELGTSVFDRSGWRAEPTALGHFIASRAEELDVAARTLIADVERVAAGRAGEIRLGLAPSAMRLFLSHVVDGLEATGDAISLEVTPGSADQVVAGLHAGELDMAICSPLDGPTSTITSEPVVDSEVHWFVHPSHPLASRSTVGSRDIAEFPIAMPPMESPYDRTFGELMGVRPERYGKRLVCSDYDALIRVARTHPRYVTIGPEPIFREEIERGGLIALAVPEPIEHHLELHTRRYIAGLPASRTLRELIRSIGERI